MNTSLRRLTMILMGLIVLLLANATFSQVFSADSLRLDPRNQRILLNEYSRQRGQITAAGQLLAYSISSDDRLKFQRVYPHGEIYAPITGFYSLRYSSTELEHTEDNILNGSDSRLFGVRLTDFLTGRSPRGGSVETTIIPHIQQAGWDAMAQQCDHGCRGAVVALEPTTGKILAMISTPSYNPNLLASHNTQKQGDAWENLRDNPAGPLINRTIAETYPPGSTFKIITTAAALQAGISLDEPFTDAARIPLPHSSATIENYGGRPCNGSDHDDHTVSIATAFIHSCNTAFVQLGMRLGAESLRQMADAFGFDQSFNSIPLQVAKSTLGPMIDDASVAMSSIGQKDVAITPLNNALIAATIANGGIVMQPYLIDALYGPNLAMITHSSPQEQRRAISPDIAAKLTELMVHAENAIQREGTLSDIHIASKTGTAEHGADPQHTPPHAWYVAFAPAEAPKIAVAVVVENGGDQMGATGASVAAPIGRAVISAALRERQ